MTFDRQGIGGIQRDEVRNDFLIFGDCIKLMTELFSENWMAYRIASRLKFSRSSRDIS